MMRETKHLTVLWGKLPEPIQEPAEPVLGTLDPVDLAEPAMNLIGQVSSKVRTKSGPEHKQRPARDKPGPSYAPARI